MIEVELAVWKNSLPAMAFLITRTLPLRNDIGISQWQLLAHTYEEFAASQQHRHPVYLISNEGAVEDSLQSMLEKVYG